MLTRRPHFPVNTKNRPILSYLFVGLEGFWFEDLGVTGCTNLVNQKTFNLFLTSNLLTFLTSNLKVRR